VEQWLNPDRICSYDNISFIPKDKHAPTRDVGSWAGLWMRVDLPGDREGAFYNSEDKPLKGTTGWMERSVVLDVAPDAAVVSFGVTGNGKGTVLIDDLKFEVVSQDVPVDVQPSYQPPMASKPAL